MNAGEGAIVDVVDDQKTITLCIREGTGEEMFFRVEIYIQSHILTYLKYVDKEIC